METFEVEIEVRCSNCHYHDMPDYEDPCKTCRENATDEDDYPEFLYAEG